MDVEVFKSKLSDCNGCNRKEDLENSEDDQVRVKRKTLQAVLEKCQRALELLNTTNCVDEDDESRVDCDDDRRGDGSGRLCGEREVDELCDLLKSKVECPEFLDKIEGAQASLPQNISGMVLIKFEEELEPRNNFEEGSSWDVVSDIDLWESTDIDVDQEDFVVVKQEDIVEGIACFMAAYLLSLKETKELTPNQLQEALSKTFSVKKKKGKLRKAWDGSKVIYNVASWGATAIGIYQNPVIIRVATNAFWTSCHVISKLL